MAKKQVETEDKTLNTLNNTLSTAGEKIIKNRKIIMWSGGALLAVVLGIMAYIFLYSQPREQEAMNAFGKAWAENIEQKNDTITVKKMQEVAQKYDGTDAANLANLDAAERLYDMGKFQDALNHLNKFSTKEKVLMSQALCLKGDCYVEMKKYPEALKEYDEAIKKADGNEVTTPRFLDKKAKVYAAQNDHAKALECYETIKKDYPQVADQYAVDAYIAVEKKAAGK